MKTHSSSIICHCYYNNLPFFLSKKRDFFPFSDYLYLKYLYREYLMWYSVDYVMH